MVKYYAAIGRLLIHNKIPAVISSDKENHLTVAEFILWSSLSRNIMNKESLESEFNRRLRTSRINDDISFEQTLNRLEMRGLVTSGEDYIAAGALYNLLKGLYILPLGKVNLFKRYAAFLYFLLVKRVPFDRCRQYLKVQNYTALDNKIVALARKTDVTIAELIKICDNDMWDVKGENDIMDKLYADGLDSSQTENYSAFSKSQNKVLTAVVNLYLNGQLIFDKAYDNNALNGKKSTFGGKINLTKTVIQAMAVFLCDIRRKEYNEIDELNYKFREKCE